MKCKDCNYAWNEKFKTELKGRMIVKGIKCPKCGSDNLTVCVVFEKNRKKKKRIFKKKALRRVFG